MLTPNKLKPVLDTCLFQPVSQITGLPPHEEQLGEIRTPAAYCVHPLPDYRALVKGLSLWPWPM